MFSTDVRWVVLLFSLRLTDTSFAMDTECEIKSSCSLSRCETHTDLMTVVSDSNIALNCTIISGGLAPNMTWRQVKSSTGFSKLALEQSNSTKSGWKYLCRCTTIKFARKCLLSQVSIRFVPLSQPSLVSFYF